MKKWILLVIAIQFLALLSVAVKREWIHRYGETVFLRTAPVDPRDLFRGDYVQLQYDIGFPDAARISEELVSALEEDEKSHREVFVWLKQNENGVAEIDSVSSDKPGSGMYIKGQTGYKLWRRWRQNGNIKYGIEKYFVEQGSGTAIEEIRGHAQQWQTAMEVEVALGGDGTAVIKGHRWSDLGVKLEVLEMPTNPAAGGDEAPPQRRNAKIAMHLLNQSNHPIGIVDTPGNCSFRLVQNENSQFGLAAVNSTFSFPERDCDHEAQTVHRLAANEIYTVTMDFEDPGWFVEHDGKKLSLADIPSTFLGFRLEYQPPPGETIQVPGEMRIWDARIRSARFIASGRID